MPYLDLIDESKRESLLASAQKSSSKFNLKYDAFVHFSRKDLKASVKREMNKNWKIHFSINLDDLPKAWDTVYPMLVEHGTVFKVINTNVLSKLKEQRAKAIESLEEEMQTMREAFEAHTLDYKNLLATAKTHCTEWRKELSFLRDCTTEEDRIKALVPFEFNYYARAITQLQQHQLEDSRMEKGMQITIYIPPGGEKVYESLADEIEKRLNQAHIRPGQIYPSDRALGKYASIRHPGIEYHDAVTVTSYNPDEKEDPFDALYSLEREQFMKELREQAQAFLETPLNDSMSPSAITKARKQQELGNLIRYKLEEYEKWDVGTLDQRRSRYDELREDVTDIFMMHNMSEVSGEARRAKRASGARFFKTVETLDSSSHAGQASATIEEDELEDWTLIESEDLPKDPTDMKGNPTPPSYMKKQ